MWATEGIQRVKRKASSKVESSNRKTDATDAENNHVYSPDSDVIHRENMNLIIK